MKTTGKKDSGQLFEKALQTLETTDDSLMFDEINAFSDLTKERIEKFKCVWEKLTPKRKEQFIESVLVAATDDLLLDFAGVAGQSLHDKNPLIRSISLELLRDERKTSVLEEVIDIADQDTDTFVRIDAIAFLGHCLIDFECEPRYEKITQRILAHLEALRDDPAELIRLQVMESLALIDHEWVEPLIQKCLLSNDETKIRAGLRAIQNSMNLKWRQDVLDFLDHENIDIRIDAIRAAGLMQLKQALPKILQLLTNFDQLDSDTLENAILAASQIGGEQAEEMIDMLGEVYEDEDELWEVFEEARSNLDLVSFQNEMAQKPEFKDFLKELEENEKEDFSEEDMDNFVSMLRERIESLPEPAEDADSDEDEDEDEDDDEEHAGHRHPHRHGFQKAEEIDWSQFRIIEDPDADELDELDDLDLDDLDLDSLGLDDLG